MFRGSPCNGINDMAGNCSDRVPLKFPKPRAPVSHRAVMVTGLATISPEEYSLIIRDVPPDERNQFRVHCPVEDNLLGYQDNANKNFFFGIISYNKINMAEYLYIVVQQHQIVMFIGIVKDNIV